MLLGEVLEARWMLAQTTGLPLDDIDAANPSALLSANAGGGADAAGPRITNLLVAGTDWSSLFRGQLVAGGLGTTAGYAIPAGANQLKSLPWSGLNQIVVQFSEDVNVQQDDLAVNGVAVPLYGYNGFSYNGATFTGTWTLTTAIGNDNVTLALDGHSATGVRDTGGNLLNGEWTNGASSFPSGDGTAGGDFNLLWHALPGDFNQDGAVNVSDIQQVATSWLQGNPLRDGNADGIVDISEVQLVAEAWLAATAPDTQPPSAPASLTATAAGTTQINMSWPAATDNVAVTGYRIERQGPGGGGFVEIGTAVGTTYNDTGLIPNTAYSYRVRATDATGNLGQYSPVAAATTLAPVGLVAAYAFREGSGTTVTDLSGYANTGALSGATWSTGGKYDNALSFNGSNALVTVADSASLDLTTGMTLEAWVNPSVIDAAWRDVIYKRSDVYYLEGSSPQAEAPATGGTFSSGVVAGTAGLPTNTWSHVAATYDGTTMRLYVNGAQVASRAQTGPIQTSSGVLSIGGDSLNGQYFAGLIDEVRIYNRALSPSEIQADMATPVDPTPDTTSPSVSVTAPANGANASGNVTINATASDNVGVVGVQFLVDGVPMGAEDMTAPFSLSWDSSQVANGQHTLSARARDAAGNSKLSTAITINVSNVNNPALVGHWSSVMDWPLVAINMVLLNDGKILMWDGGADFSQGGQSAQIWDPATNTFTDVPVANPDGSERDIFCAGQTVLADGRVLLVGGHALNNPDLVGAAMSNIFDPATGQWTLAPDMAYGRWYPTATALPDGRAITIGGSDTSFTDYIPTPEIFDPVTNTWSQLTGADQAIPNYAFVYVLPNGNVLAAGSDESPMATYSLNLSTRTWSVVDPTVLNAGSGVMYLPGKVMKTGSSYVPGVQIPYVGVPSAATTYVLDMTQPSPAWQQTASMANPRTHLNLTVLPDGNVVAIGGSSDMSGERDQYAVLPAEMWSPTTKTWTTMASMQTPRMYHSTALLLPDGRVLSAGGGRDGGATDYLNAEIYSPPYLYKGARPTVTSAPDIVSYGSNFFVQTPDATDIASVSLIRNGSVTHADDMDQRFVPLVFTQGSGGLNVQAPADANLAPPGEYMLFIVNHNGVPSIAPMVHLPAVYEDVQPPTATTGLAATGAVGTAALGWNAATDNNGVAHYNVYRSTTAGFTPSVANLVAQPTTINYTDTGLAAGTYYYRVAAEDAAGNVGPASGQASATVAADTVAPSVSVTSPSNGASISGTVAVNATASDNIGIAGVQFLLDGNDVGTEDTVAPYSFSWNTLTTSSGTHVLRARARDTGGNTTLSASINVTVSNAVPNGLVLAMGFEEATGTTTSDLSGHGNTGTLSGATWSTSGKYGNALVFNGSSALVTVADSASLDLTTGMTLEAWVNPSLGGGWRDVIYKASDVYYLEGSSSPSGAPAMGGTFSANSLFGAAALPVDTWSHVAATYNGTTMRLYVNGTQVASRAQTGSIQVSTGALSIGGDSLYAQFFAGMIDEVRIYSRALSVSEIQSDMNMPIGGAGGGSGAAMAVAGADPRAAFEVLAFDDAGNLAAVQAIGSVAGSAADLLASQSAAVNLMADALPGSRRRTFDAKPFARFPADDGRTVANALADPAAAAPHTRSERVLDAVWAEFDSLDAHTPGKHRRGHPLA